MSSPSIWKRAAVVDRSDVCGLTGACARLPPTASLIGVGSGLELRQPRKAAG